MLNEPQIYDKLFFFVFIIFHTDSENHKFIQCKQNLVSHMIVALH